jgi:hypothetical protein
MTSYWPAKTAHQLTAHQLTAHQLLRSSAAQFGIAAQSTNINCQAAQFLGRRLEAKNIQGLFASRLVSARFKAAGLEQIVH